VTRSQAVVRLEKQHMKSTKLFQALVLWGAAFGAASLGGCSEDPPARSPDAAVLVDANRGDGDVDRPADAKPDSGSDAAADTADTGVRLDAGADSRPDAGTDVSDAAPDAADVNGDATSDLGSDVQHDIAPGEVIGWPPTK
jgi:hypothetical protein